MFPGRSSAARSRVDKLSLLPKPRRTGSMERGPGPGPGDARRASARSSSAEPARAGPRLSRDASASKIPLNRKSKSQQGLNDRHGQHPVAMTPLRGSTYSRATTTPVRTPSKDGGSRSWQASVERALAFFTYKDQRPLSEAAWQRAEYQRVQAALLARGEGEPGGALQLIRPLTIARFVDICGGLLHAICEAKLNSDNYLTRLPNLAKRFLYPGTVSKSWLKTVNTLHAFPQALAIISYFLDLLDHIECPVSDEWLYREQEERACLRREYLLRCWLRFETDSDFTEEQAEYLRGLRDLLGDDERRIAHLTGANNELEAALNDESEQAARADEERTRGRRDALAAAVRGLRIEARGLRAHAQDEAARAQRHGADHAALDADVAGVAAEIERLKSELTTQTMSVSERAQLVADAQYAARVADSKRSLAEQLAKMADSKEAELMSWQQRALDSCVQYKRALVQLAARHPHLAALAVDEKELMEEACAAALSRGVDTLRALLADTKEQRAGLERARLHQHRHFATLLEEARASVAELEGGVEREAAAADAEAAREAADAARWGRARAELHERLSRAAAPLDADADARAARAHNDLHHWMHQDELWRDRLRALRQYAEEARAALARELAAHKRHSADRLKSTVASWHRALDDIHA